VLLANLIRRIIHRLPGFRRSDWALTTFKGWFLGCGATLLVGFLLWLAGTAVIFIQPDRGPTRSPDAGVLVIVFGLVFLLVCWGSGFAALLAAYVIAWILRWTRRRHEQAKPNYLPFEE
jgi:hypothetical protein